jgi:hypothetical protein
MKDAAGNLSSLLSVSDGAPGVSAAPHSAVRRPREWEEKLKPKLDFLFLVVLLGAIGFAGMRRVSAVADPDVWWHVRTGEWIVQHGSIPRQDMFAWVTMGKPWVDYTWLFDLLAAKLFRGFSYRGLLSMTAVLSLLNIAALTALLARYTYLIRALILSIFAYVAMMPVATPRPWLFTILFFTICLSLLLQACERANPWWLLPIVPLMAVWANIHVQFVYGVALVGLFALQQSIPAFRHEAFSTPNGRVRLPAIWLWALLAASSLATLANPRGWRLFTVVYEYATEKAPLDFVQEMQSPSFRDLASWLALGLVCLGWFALGRSRGRTLALSVLMAASCYCAFRAVRDIWFPLIVSTLVIAQWWGVGGPPRRAMQWKGWMAALALSLACALPIHGLGVSNAAAQKLIDEKYPVRACDFVISHRLPGPLYNSYGWGGYLIWRMPEMPVSIDGRANLHGDDRVTQSVKSLAGGEIWARDKELIAARTILIERSAALASVLRASPKFRVLYEDGVAMVIQPAV